MLPDDGLCLRRIVIGSLDVVVGGRLRHRLLLLLLLLLSVALGSLCRVVRVSHVERSCVLLVEVDEESQLARVVVEHGEASCRL